MKSRSHGSDLSPDSSDRCYWHSTHAFPPESDWMRCLLDKLIWAYGYWAPLKGICDAMLAVLSLACFVASNLRASLSPLYCVAQNVKMLNERDTHPAHLDDGVSIAHEISRLSMICTERNYALFLTHRLHRHMAHSKQCHHCKLQTMKIISHICYILIKRDIPIEFAMHSGNF